LHRQKFFLRESLDSALPTSGAEGATAPETLRQTDRVEVDTLESGAARMKSGQASTDGRNRVAPHATREISQVTGQRGREQSRVMSLC